MAGGGHGGKHSLPPCQHQRFLSGEWGVELETYEAVQARERLQARSPAALKQCIAPYVLDPAAHLAEPVRFEVLRAARPEEARLLQAQFDTLPVLATPTDLWQRAIELGQACPGSAELSSASTCWWPP